MDDAQAYAFSLLCAVFVCRLLFDYIKPEDMERVEGDGMACAHDTRHSSACCTQYGADLGCSSMCSIESRFLEKKTSTVRFPLFSP